MGGAFLWGLVAGSAFLIAGLVALIFDIGPKPLGVLMGFGSGALIGTATGIGFALVFALVELA